MTNGPSVPYLAQHLARDLGVKFSLVETRAKALQEAGLLPPNRKEGGKHVSAVLEPQHALMVLLAVMSGASATSAAKEATIYADLPLLISSLDQSCLGGGHVGRHLGPEDSRFATEVRDYGSTLLRLLRTGMTSAWLIKQPVIEVDVICLGGGIGTHSALVVVSPVSPPIKAKMAMNLYYGFTENPTGARPDDAPVCRLDAYRQVPGTILARLAALFPDEAHRHHAADLEEAASGNFVFPALEEAAHG